LILDEKHKADLQFVKDKPAEILSEFVRIAIEFIKNGSNPKLYAGAARALNIDARQVESVVQSMAHLFSESAKYSISEADFVATLVLLGFSKEKSDMLKEVYLDNKQEIRRVQTALSMDLPHYSDLEWRLDIQLSSRALRNQISPVFLLRLDTNESGKTASQFLQTDYNNLKNLTEELEKALKESKSAYTRRIMRNIK